MHLQDWHHIWHHKKINTKNLILANVFFRPQFSNFPSIWTLSSNNKIHRLYERCLRKVHSDKKIRFWRTFSKRSFCFYPPSKCQYIFCDWKFKLSSFLQYHSMLHPLYLIFVKLIENNFRGLHLHNLKFLLTMSLHTTLAQSHFHYICKISCQGSALVQPEIFIFMLKWHILRYTRTPWFSLHS